MKKLEEKIKELIEVIKEMDEEEKIEAINLVKENLHQMSPLKKHPVDCVLWVKAERVQANQYNPNRVASPELKLLHTSIKMDGYTQPIVTYALANNQREVVDGYHRSLAEKKYTDIHKQVKGYLPVTTINKPIEERMGSTIRHNRARGTHQIKGMSHIVLELASSGWSDWDICKKLGMDLDEVLRLKQITGLKEAFQNMDFSNSWEEFERKQNKEK